MVPNIPCFSFLIWSIGVKYNVHKVTKRLTSCEAFVQGMCSYRVCVHGFQPLLVLRINTRQLLRSREKRQQVGEPLPWEGKVPSPGDWGNYHGKNTLQGLELTYTLHDIYSSWHFNLWVIYSIAYRAMAFPFIAFSSSLSDLESTPVDSILPPATRYCFWTRPTAMPGLLWQGGLKIHQGMWRALNSPSVLKFSPSGMTKWCWV